MSTLSGRTLTRTGNYCHGCHARIEVGELRHDGNWTAALSLTAQQVNLLLLAAAEYEELSEESQHISNAVEFVDWVKVDALPGLYSRETQRERRAEAKEVA